MSALPSNALQGAIHKLAFREPLSADDAEGAFDMVMRGEATPVVSSNSPAAAARACNRARIIAGSFPTTIQLSGPRETFKTESAMIVSRFATQKGFDMLAGIMPELVKDDVVLIPYTMALKLYPAVRRKLALTASARLGPEERRRNQQIRASVEAAGRGEPQPIEG